MGLSLASQSERYEPPRKCPRRRPRGWPPRRSRAQPRRARPVPPGQAPAARDARAGQPRATSRRRSAGTGAPRRLTPPAGSPGPPRGAHPRAAARAIAAYLKGVGLRVDRPLLGPRGAQQPPVRGAGVQSAAHRRDQRRRDPPATPRPAPPSSQLRGAPGPGRRRGSRREARGTRRAGPLGTSRGHAHTQERAPPGRGTGGEGGGCRAQLLLPIFSLVSC